MLLPASGNREQKLVSMASPQYPQKGSQKWWGKLSYAPLLDDLFQTVEQGH